ncbi:MAG: arabinan endo-1,5-alpha-L-arabinosidase, partial [Propionibacteriaceae bacterium]
MAAATALAALAACTTGAEQAPAPTVTATTASPTGTGQPTLTGEITPIHDPALIVADGTWYVFSTGRVRRENGGTIQIWTSPDGVAWSAAGSVWDEIPAWIDKRFAGGVLPDNLWAPEIHEHDGTFYLYYSASRFGTDDSVTALATNTTLDPKDPDYRWKDQGPVLVSPVADLDRGDPSVTFNAIDAGIIEDSQGQPFMTIGSFWSGIFLVPLEWPSGKPVKGWKAKTVHLAQRQVEGDPIEAAYITRHQDYFYLFVSFDLCCRGADSTYKIAVGRSRSVQGPYVDRDGTKMLEGGGTDILETDGDQVGPGGQSVFDDTLAFHFYDGVTGYVPTLGLRRIDWSAGWPSVT